MLGRIVGEILRRPALLAGLSIAAIILVHNQATSFGMVR